MISDNIKNIQDRIASSLEKSGRKDDVRLVAVTKTHGADEIRQILGCGIYDLGENRVKELTEKYELLPDKNIRWHLIGTLQTNKVKYIIDKVHLIHSVDTLRLIDEIDKQAKKHGLKVNILLQINIAREEQKHGFSEEEIRDALMHCTTKENIIVKGLMMMAPAGESAEKLCDLFKKTEKIYTKLMNFSGIYDNIDIDTLSMGMTDDFECAVMCGSNTVRIGRALFI